jgi:aerobic-type carbon monoxide dehydrogenase small subunit (CoxS/CutS family)
LELSLCIGVLRMGGDAMSLLFRGPDKVDLLLNVNGRDIQVTVEPRRTLLSVLREELGLTGAKHGCGRGTCGACTVIIDGETVYSCMTLAIDCEGREIRTVEGLASGKDLHLVQESFIKHDGYQCGFCTPGQVMSAVALLEHNPDPTEDEIRYEMSGNLCRCGAYPNIVLAVQAAAEEG